MIRSVHKCLGGILILIIVAGSGYVVLLCDQNSVVFASLESKTEEGQPVFNRVKLISGWQQDVWLMQQSHQGVNVHGAKWDHLAIVVDKTKLPYEASFYQLTPGEWHPADGALNTVPFKTRCYACHPNGPRAIRPDLTSQQLSFEDRLRIQVMNLRIKTYGFTRSVSGVDVDDGVPFRSNYSVLQRPLKLKSCTKCHKEGGLRGELTMEHLETARFLIDNHFMPPLPFGIDEEDLSLFDHLLSIN